MRDINRCTRCIMDDTSDPTIEFDESGICNYCSHALKIKDKVYFPNAEGQKKLVSTIEKIKEDEKNKPYDCVMGISGGLDSSYLAYIGYKHGLRILGIHVDDGFDTDISIHNIEKLVKATNMKLVIVKPDEKQYYGLIKAYMRAGVPNLAVPQDNITIATVYDNLRKNNLKYFATGGNFLLEGILQKGNSHPYVDTLNLKDINRRFGETSIDNLPLLSSWRKLYDSKILNIETPRLLNYVDYNRDNAFSELNKFCGFEYYGSKHLENILTAFIQLYWLPKKFNVDKRTSHLSSMIVSGQLSREQALKEYSKPLYDEPMMNEYIYVIKEKLNISDNEFDEIMNLPIKQHTDYKYDKLMSYYRKISEKLKHN